MRLISRTFFTKDIRIVRSVRKNTKLPDDTEERIVKCLDRALDTLGQSVKHVTYFYLAKEEDLVPKDIVINTQRFLHALHNLFGFGADLIEQWIVKELRKEVDLSLEESGNLPDAIKNARARLASRSVS